MRTRMASQRFSASQVCQIVTGEDGDMDYMFPGSDDDLDMEDMDDLESQGDSESESDTEMDQVGGNSSHRKKISFPMLGKG